MKFQNEVKVDKHKKIVSFADNEWRYFFTFKDASHVCSYFGFYGKPQDRNKDFTQKYGITPNNLKRCVNAAMCSVWTKGIDHLVKRYAFTANGKLNHMMVQQIWEHMDIVQQAEKDRLENILPFVVFYGKNPQELKEIFGKSLWKQLCKNSMTRNLYLAKYASRQTRYVGGGLRQLVSVGNKFPSYAIKAGGNWCLDWSEESLWIWESGLVETKGKVKHIPRGSYWMNCYRDTKRMALSLGKTFNDKWTPEKMESKHQEYVRAINALKYSSTPFNHLKSFPVDNLTHGCFTATLCKSPLLVREEGDAMHHCVGSYADLVAQGKYLVYSIRKGDNRSSTLGIRVDGDKYTFNQHYGHCNAPVNDEDEIKLSATILKQLNGLSDEK